MTEPRLLFMAKPPPKVLNAMMATVRRHGLDTQLGDTMFPIVNWHQTFSDRYWNVVGLRKKMLRAGAAISAVAFLLTLNRIRDQGRDDPIHWAFKAKGKPPGFAALLSAVRLALSAEGIDGGAGHTPHVTISYRAPQRITRTEMDPVHWMIDETLLVVGGGRPYRYDVIGRWPLLPAAEPAMPQFSLF